MYHRIFRNKARFHGAGIHMKFTRVALRHLGDIKFSSDLRLEKYFNT